MATLQEQLLLNQIDEQKLNQLLNPLKKFNSQGIATLSPLSFQYPFLNNQTSPIEGFPNFNMTQNQTESFEGFPVFNTTRDQVNFTDVVEDQTSPTEGFPSDIPKSKKGLDSLLSFLIGLKIPGFSILKEALKKGQPYQELDPRASIKGGIYNIDGVNLPVEMVNDAYNPKTQLNRFDRAKDKFQDTGNLLDLFAASRTGTEFSNLKKILDYQKDKETVDRSFVDRPKSERKFTGSGKTGMGRNPDKFK